MSVDSFASAFVGEVKHIVGDYSLSNQHGILLPT